jgi:hypothetical protein
MGSPDMKKQLDVRTLCEEARRFAEIESTHPEPAIYGVTDGKAVGTYFEHKFQGYLQTKYVAEIADEILHKPPIVGYLTISNALQWRLQYSRVIEEAGNVAGIHRLR